MRRLFLLCVTGVVAAIVSGLLLSAYTLRWQIEAVWEAAIEDCHAGGLRLMIADLVAAGRDRDRVATELAARFPYPVRLAAISSLPPDAQRQFARGLDVAVYWVAPEAGHARHVAGRVPGSADALCLGPFPDTVAPGVEAAIDGWMDLVVERITAAADRPAAIAALQPLFPQRILIADKPLPDPGHRPPLEIGETRFTPQGPAGGSTEAGPKAMRYYAEALLADGSGYVRLGPFAALDVNGPATFVRFLATTVPLILAILAALLWPIGRQLHRLERAATRLAEGDLGVRATSDALGAMKPLADSFNAMARRIETLLTAQRNVLQAVSHEIRTPLARLRFAAELAAGAATDTDRTAKLAVIDSAVEELDDLVQELTELVRLDTTVSRLSAEPVDAHGVLAECIAEAGWFQLPVAIRFTPPPAESPPMIFVEERGFRRAIDNLIGNAVRHAQRQVEVSLHPEGRWLVVEIDDDGPGIAPERRAAVVEPFVQLAPVSEPSTGVGLGLAIVDRIVRRHGGRLELLDSPAGGLRARTTWPRWEPGPNEEEASC